MKRKFIFYTILLLPAVVLLGMLLAIIQDLLAIRSVDPAKVHAELKNHLAGKTASSFPLPGKIFHRDPSKRLVYVFGASSVVISDGGTFSDYLETAADGLQVVNLGVNGIDSFSVRERFTEALAAARPDLIILYYGHNDYNNAYQGFIVPNHFERFNLLLKISRLFHDGEKPAGVLLSEDYYWFSRLTRPRVFKFFERLGLIRIDSRDYAEINDLIAGHFIRNNDAIIGMAASMKIPVILITPVSNLRAEPFGDIGTTTALYRKGMAAADYRESLRFLKMARDAEILTYDLRAKSPVVDAVRKAGASGVHVLDLEQELENRGFDFGYSGFLDYLHFNDGSHRLVATIIHEFINQRRLAGTEKRNR